MINIKCQKDTPVVDQQLLIHAWYLGLIIEMPGGFFSWEHRDEKVRPPNPDEKMHPHNLKNKRVGPP